MLRTITAANRQCRCRRVPERSSGNHLRSTKRHYHIHVHARQWNFLDRNARRGNIARVTALSARSEGDVISCVNARMTLTAFCNRAKKFLRVKIYGRSDIRACYILHDCINCYSFFTFLKIYFTIFLIKLWIFFVKKNVEIYAKNLERSLLKGKFFKN